MKTRDVIATIAVLMPVVFTQPAQAQDLTALQSLACEAVLCLSTGNPPTECKPSLKKYFSIVLSKPWKTAQARANFLKLCPDVTEAKASKMAQDSAQTEDSPEGSKPYLAAEEAEASQSSEPADDTATATPPREEIQAALNTLKPAWALQAKESKAARTVLESCIAKRKAGSVSDCDIEQADFDAKRVPAIMLRDEIGRYESMLAKSSQ